MMMPRMDGLTLAREIKGQGGPADHRPLGDRRRRLQGRPPRGGRRGLRHEALPLPGAAGPDQPGAAAARRQGPPPEPRPRAEPDPRPPPPRGDRRPASRPADADRVAAPLRPRRQPRPDRDDRNAPRPRLGRDRGRRPVVRLGHDAPPPPEGRARPEPARPPPDRPRRRLPARRRDRTPTGAADGSDASTTRIDRASDGSSRDPLRRDRRTRPRRSTRTAGASRFGRQRPVVPDPADRRPHRGGDPARWPASGSSCCITDTCRGHGRGETLGADPAVRDRHRRR